MKILLNRIFPKNLNNNYQGSKVALYVFYTLTAFTLWRSQHHLLSEDGGAQSIATIPLDTFTKEGATTVIGLFGLWGLSQLIIGVVYLVVSIRYRAMIPLMYLLMFAEYLMRAVYFPTSKPIPTSGTAPGAAGNIPLIIITLCMFFFALIQKKKG